MQFVYDVLFRAIDYSYNESREALLTLASKQNVTLAFNLRALRRKHFWAIELPLGIFLGDLRPGLVTLDDDMRVRDGILDRIYRQNKAKRLHSGRMVIHWNGSVFYHQQIIRAIKDCEVTALPELFQAFHEFLAAAQNNPELIKGKKTRPFIPLEQRKAEFGYIARGPSWLPEEDTILRQWFGPRTVGADAGYHALLTDQEWESVLSALNHRRTRASIRQRMVAMNRALRAELSIDGYIPRDRYREYFSRALGEKPRKPRLSLPRRKRRNNANSS